MTKLGFRRLLAIGVLALTVSALVLSPMVKASPFGQGVFGADVPFGSLTSLAINLGGNVSLTLAPDTGNLRGTGSHTVTVTSTDVVGYQLFVHGVTSTNLTNGGYSVPASANSTPAALALNTWGYNTNASSNFVGMLLSPTLIKDTSGPSKTGDSTTVTYGAYTSPVQAAGTYTASVVYTVVAENQ